MRAATASLAEANARTPLASVDDDVKKVHSLIRWNKLDDVKELLMLNGTLVNTRDAGNGNTCLHIAAQNGHMDIVKFLVSDAEADVDARNNLGHTSLHMAVSNDFHDVRDFLIHSGADREVVNNEGHLARYGLEGEKDLHSVSGKLNSFEIATTEEALLNSLDNLRESAQHLNKADFVAKGLKTKRLRTAVWTGDVQKSFVATVSAIA